MAAEPSAAFAISMATITTCGLRLKTPTASSSPATAAHRSASMAARAGARKTTSQPAQFYRVSVDNDFPYHIYGAQQDNSTVATLSRSNGGAITERDWHDVGGGESGWIAADPLNSNFVYAGSYDGLLTRLDTKTGTLRNVNAWPDNPMGSGVEAMKYRFQWSFPLLFSPNNPKRALRRQQRSPCHHRRRPALDGHEPRPDAQR